MNKQALMWSSYFGESYTNRNNITPDQFDQMYLSQYGITRSQMNQSFLVGLDRNFRILEVGSNVGIQLNLLQSMGFNNLYGIDISPYAVELSKKNTRNINIIHGEAVDIPFKNGYFDIVFTSGVLIHIPEEDLKQVMNEIYRCSCWGIWGFEYFSEKRIGVTGYHDNNDMLWKDDFLRKYLSAFHNLKIVKEEKYNFIGTDYFDTMFMLAKV